jgi:hypothetical protein
MLLAWNRHGNYTVPLIGMFSITLSGGDTDFDADSKT